MGAVTSCPFIVTVSWVGSGRRGVGVSGCGAVVCCRLDELLPSSELALSSAGEAASPEELPWPEDTAPEEDDPDDELPEELLLELLLELPVAAIIAMGVPLLWGSAAGRPGMDVL